MIPSRHVRRQNWLLFIAMMLVSPGCTKHNASDPESAPTQSAKNKVAKPTFVAAERKLAMGLLDEAEKIAERLLLENDSDARTQLLVAKIAKEKRDDARAIAITQEIGFDHDRFGGQAAELCVLAARRSGDFASLERSLIAMTTIDPSNPKWLREVARLLQDQGRLEQASRFIKPLAASGHATLDELASLILPVAVDAESTKEDQPDPQDYPTPLSKSQWLRAVGNLRQAQSVLIPVVSEQSASPEAFAVSLSLLIEQQKTDEFRRLLRSCPEDAKSFSDYWSAVGLALIQVKQFEGAVACLLRCVEIDPTNRVATQRLALSFDALDRPQDAEQFRYRGVALAQTESLLKRLRAGEDSLSLRQEMAKRLLEIERPFEALAWRRLSLDPGSPAIRQVTMQQQALASNPGTSLVASESALMQLRPSDFDYQEPLRQFLSAAPTNQNAAPTPRQPMATPRFMNVAKQTGADFEYYLGPERTLHPIPLYASLGGGIAVIDYDSDGWPDVYFCQAGCLPNGPKSKLTDELHRNIQGQFRRHESVAEVENRSYSTGVTAGDINQDGLPDLFVGALGENQVMINQGDGTFANRTATVRTDGDQFTVSVAIADLDTNGLPELIEINYIELDGALSPMKKSVDGKWIQQMPLLNFGAADRVLFSDGSGFFEGQLISEEVVEPGTGLGLIVTDFDVDGQNEIFVGNDARANHLLKFDRTQQTFVNSANTAGLSLGFSGTAMACMGIASGDFDRDGTLDLHITNYSKEPANLFLQSAGGTFQDYAIRYGLKDASEPMVGFGTKAIDLDGNGWQDMLVTNGHVFDRSDLGEPFQMPFQIFLSKGESFETVSLSNEAGYFGKNHLGRSLTKIDYDRDAQTDFLVGHLDSATALLRNQTDTQGKSLRIELVGTRCERDAIGTQLIARLGDTQLTDSVVAGDGYLSSDEAFTEFVIPNGERLQRLDVRWPSGERQSFDNLEAGKRYLIVEGIQDAFARER